MTQLPPGQAPTVLDAYAVRLGGSRLLLSSPQACLDVLRSLEQAAAAARRNGLPTPSRIAWLIAALDAELADHGAAAAHGSAALPREPNLPAFQPQTEPADTQEAARMLGIQARQVRNLAAQLGGRKVNRSWVFDRRQLAVEAQRRTAAANTRTAER